jgi:DNA-binding transcriptional ArsR family regulator
MVLEELMLRSTGDGDGCVASVSVRTLAASLGLAKGTVAGALGRLRDAGLVIALQDREETGQFTVGVYRLSVPADALAVLPATLPVASSSTFEPARRRALRHTANDAIQLALLEPT